MPIKIPDSLPARAVLESERIFVMTEYRAIHQDIRPLNLLILNLMPTKIVTETQLLRKLSNTPLQINVDLMYTSSYRSRNTDMAYLSSFYTTFDAIRDKRYDGMIITGAPVEQMEFEDVVEPDARLLDAAHLLGRAGGTLLSLRDSEAPTEEKGLRHLPA